MGSNHGKKALPDNEFNIKFIDENPYIIQLLEKYQNYLKIQILSKKNKKCIVIKERVAYSEGYILNIISNNEKENKQIINCLFLEFNINDEKSFEEIKLLYKEKLQEKQKEHLICLIGIKHDSVFGKNEDKAGLFAQTRNLGFFAVNDSNEIYIKNFIYDLLEYLIIEREERKNKIKNKQEFNICFLGNKDCGAKTSLIKAIKGEKFTPKKPLNSCSISQSKIIQINKRTICLQLLDTEKKKDNTSEFIIPYAKKSDCIVIGFDVTDKNGLKSVMDLYNDVKWNTKANLWYLIGNKIDLHKERKIKKEEALKIAEEYNFRYFETSCLTGEGVQEFLDDLSNEVIKL